MKRTAVATATVIVCWFAGFRIADAAPLPTDKVLLVAKGGRIKRLMFMNAPLPDAFEFVEKHLTQKPLVDRQVRQSWKEKTVYVNMADVSWRDAYRLLVFSERYDGYDERDGNIRVEFFPRSRP